MKKRVLSLLLAMLMVMTLVPTAALADDTDNVIDSGYCGGEGDGTNLTWTLYKNGTLEISGTGAMASWANNIGQLSPWRDNYYNTIKNVYVDAGVTSIGDYAFGGCKSLTSITIPDNVTSIGRGAFFHCNSLTNIIIPDSVASIGNSAFEGCTGLTSVTIPDSVTRIGGYAFSGCTGLTSITIPNGVKIIGNSAFEGCTGLTSVAIPNSVTYIDSSLFYGCTSLTSVTIPDSVASIGSSAFYGCTGLTSITIPNSVTYISHSVFYGCTGLTSVTIPDGVTIIEYSAFYCCTGLTCVSLPKNVKTICSAAFFYCRNIKDVYYAGSETEWNAIDIRPDNEPITNASIHYVGETHTHDYKSTVTEPTCTEDGYTTYTCSCGETYTSDIVPAKGHSPVLVGAKDATCTEDGYTGDEVCSVCGDIITKGEKIEHFAHNYVNGKCATCGAIDTDNVIDSGYCGGEGDGTNLTWTLYKNGTLEISGTGKMASWFGSSYGSYGASEAPWSYHNGDYLNKKIVKIVINEGVTSIGKWAFMGCNNSLSVVIPDSVIDIEEAFAYCTGLTCITIPDSVTNIGRSAFENCTSLTSVAIPDRVTSIGGGAFDGCTGLTSITIPDRVTSIGGGAFAGCTGLTSITIPDRVTSIGGSAFSGCTGLTSVTIPNSVKNIGERAFRECGDLTSVTFPDSLVNLGSYAFQNCKSLETVNIKSCANSIGSYAFQGCTALKNLTLPSNLETIGQFAFEGCTSFETLNIPGKVSKIDNSAFSGCTALKSVSLPLSLKTVGNAAFRYCDNIEDVYYEGDSVQWSEIKIDVFNDPLTKATLHLKEHVHSFGNPVVTAPSCTEQGFTTRTCKCGETMTDTYVDALGHDYNKNGVCSRCGEREAHTHDFVETVTAPTCTEQGYTTYTCSCGETYTKNYVSALGHKIEVRSAVEPTCTEAGYTGDEVCSVCGETISQGETIDATGHHFKGKTCTDCGATRSTCDVIRGWFQDVKNFFDKIFGRI